MKIADSTPETLESGTASETLVTEDKTIAGTNVINEDVLNEKIKSYISSGIIEETYQREGLSVTFRVPTQGQFMQQQEEMDAEVFSAEGGISVDRSNLIKNNNLLAIYMAKLNKKDFVAEQGDKYYTKDGMVERKKHILETPEINVYAMMWILDRMTEFQALASEMFKDKNLKNSQ